ncbi:MAG: Amuc_1099 family pilus-like system protein [Verrucomicrobiota bacterium]
MSKAPKNIEKILLGVAVLAAGGLTYLGISKSGGVEEEFPPPSGGNGGDEVAIKDAVKVTESVTSVTSNRDFAVATIPSDKLEGGAREVNLLTGVPLFAQREDPNNPVDLPTSPDVHPPIPNVWWMKYNVSPQFADSPQRDDDGDGFSNLEEFEAGTHPGDRNIHPPLVAKLSYVKDESKPWRVEFGFDSEGLWIPRLKTGELPDEKGPGNRVNFAEALKPGDTFFAEGEMAGRFKFNGIEEREVFNKRLKITEKIKFAMFEDLSSNKKGQPYEVPSRLPKAQRSDTQQFDRTAVLDLQALGLAGQEMRVVEKTRFALPESSEDKKYLLKEVTPESVVVEWENADGETQSVTIPKGGLPEMDLSK